MTMVHRPDASPNKPPNLFGARPQGLPLSAAVWDAADDGSPLTSVAVMKALFTASRELEAQTIMFRVDVDDD